MEITNTFDTIRNVIINRRTTKPMQMNGEQIPDEHVQQLLELANWAPNHGGTEPWHFIVYAGNDAAKSFCLQHAELYRNSVAPASFLQANYDKLLHMGDLASHIIIAVMKHGKLEKIPVLEEIAAASAAVQNLLLGAQAMDIAAYWGSGGMLLKDPIKPMLNLRDEDFVLGAIYLGKSEVRKAGTRNTPINTKTEWHR